jgi:hypothetical protein
MKHLKSYNLFNEFSNENKLFEQNVTRNQFPDFEYFQDFLFDLSDDNIISNPKFISSGYTIYPKYQILHTYNRELKSTISYEMSVNPDDWQNQKCDCELIYDETYGSIFLKPDEAVTDLSKVEEEVDFEEVKTSIDYAKANKLPHKTTLELFVDNIENGKIPAVPYIYISCGNFSIDNKQRVIDCLIRIYKATGWRPYKEFWLEDYIDEGGDDVVTCIGFNPIFIKVDDKTYKNLIKSNIHNNDITKEITSYLI